MLEVMDEINFDVKWQQHLAKFDNEDRQRMDSRRPQHDERFVDNDILRWHVPHVVHHEARLALNDMDMVELKARTKRRLHEDLDASATVENSSDGTD